MIDSTRRERWYALRVKSRDEERCALTLRSRGYEVLLPTVIERRRWSDRVKTVNSALFPGYLFSKFDYRKRFPIESAPGVLKIVTLDPGGTPVDDDEIASVRVLMNTPRRMRPCAYVGKGEKVQVTGGPLRGAIGTFERLNDNSGCLHVSVTLLGRAVEVELEPFDVSVIRPYYMPAVMNVRFPNHLPACG